MEELIRRVLDELRHVRRENEILRAKVDTFDTLTQFLRSNAVQPVREVMFEDPAWQLGKKLDELEAQRARRQNTSES
jgi:hypothetical protein